MPIIINAVDGVAKNAQILRRTAKTRVKSNRNMLNNIRTKSTKLRDMGGFDPQAQADGKTAGKIMGGMAGGAAVGAAVAGPFGAMVGALAGAVGGAVAALFDNDSKDDKDETKE